MDTQLDQVPGFRHPVAVAPEDLDFEPLRNCRQAQGFHCGDPSLDEFITTSQCEEFQRRSLGYTTLVYHRGDLIAYYTLSMDGLRFDHLKKRKPLSESNYL